MIRKTLGIAACVSLVACSSPAQNGVLAELRHVTSGEVVSAGFILPRGQQVQIEGLGYRTAGKWWETRTWILDARTREVAWEWPVTERKEKKRALQDIQAYTDLPEGNYEVYYSVYPVLSWNVHGFGDLLRELGRKIFNWKSDDDELDRLYLVVRGSGQRVDQKDVAKLREDFDRTAIVSIVGVGENERRREGFTLEKPTELEVYALGEIRDNGMFDYGWIANSRTGERVWEMTLERSKHAGGASKNRYVREWITLPPGSYVAHYVTDDSHSHPDWNATPPYDPEMWGLTVRVKDAAAKRLVKPYSPAPEAQKNIVVELTRVRNSEVRSRSFSLKRPVKVRIYAIGEGQHGKMYDYGWIIDANSHRRVWIMDCSKMEHAGGGNKNRMINEVIQLNKGDYIAYYTADDSHAFRDWNTSPPYDPEHWGITVSIAEEGIKISDLVSYEAPEPPKVIATLIRMGDWERARERFSVDKDTRVRIYALGEGRSGEMFDYGSIENARTGKTVWKMTYDKTERAGGAQKNRVADETVTLARGEYILRYTSDDSHSYDDWNDAPPYDLENWGITLYRLNEP
jgi:hypothetical protein